MRVLASSQSVGELDARRRASRPHEADVVARIAAETVENLELERWRKADQRVTHDVVCETMFAPVNEMMRSVTSSADDPWLKTQRG